MKISIMFMGIITILAGIVPLLGKVVTLPSAISSGIGYNILVIVIGVFGMTYGIMSQMDLFGVQKFVVATVGLLTLFGGVIPFLGKVWSGMPSLLSNTYAVPIIVVIAGISGIAYGATQF